ncbi:ABC transporter permease, partial [Conexibacter sp. JD483]|uniref:ABC transporter permease n=1 Tax=Conexibacter sp. JD483 TaxID=3064471 RepID=UPI0028700BED
MRFSALVHLYRVRLRARAVQELLALCGIVVGVALVFAALIANTSMSGSVQQLATGIVGEASTQITSRGSGGFDADVLRQVRATDGVAAAAPIVEAAATVAVGGHSKSVTLVGGDPGLARIGGTLLRQFTASELARQRAVALPVPIADELEAGIYGPVRIDTGATSTTVPLGAELRDKDIGTLVHSPVAIVPLALARELTGMEGRTSLIYVVAKPGREAQVEQALDARFGDRLNVRPADFDAQVFDRAAYPTSQSTTMFSAFSALVGFLFAFSAVLLTVPQRRRLVTDLRLSGHPAWVQLQVMVFDAAVLGLAGSLLGLALGDQLSRQLFAAAPGYLAYAFPIGTQRIVTVESVVVAGGAGLVAACVAVLVPLRSIMRDRPAPSETEQSGHVTGRGVIGIGLLALTGTTVIVLVAPRLALAGLFLLTVALFALTGPLLRIAVRGFERVTRSLRTPVPILATLELRSGAARLRTLALAATGAVAVFATVSIGGAHADLVRGLDSSASDFDANGDVWVTAAGGAGTFAVTPFVLPRDALDAVARVDGVAGVGVYRGSFLDVGDRRAWVQAPPRTAPLIVPPSQLRDGDARLAAERLRGDGWVVLSDAIARQLGVGVGDSVLLPTPHPRPLRVAAISTNIGWPSGAIVMNADDYARRWASAEPSALQLRLDAGADAATVAAAVRATLRDGVATEVETQATRLARHQAATRDGLERLTQISVLVLVSAMLAMAAAMGGMIWQRRPALAALKVHGFPEGELWRALLLESGLLLGTGCLIGAVFGLYGQLLLSRALETITGFPVVYSTAGIVAVANLALVTTVAVAMLA